MDGSIDDYLAAIAAPQYSAFSREQVRDEVGSKALLRRTRSGLLIAETKNVFRFAAARRTDEQRVMMATLDVPGGAIAGVFTAAWHWGFPGFPLRGVEVIGRRPNDHRSAIAWVHQPRLLLPEHVTEWRGIPITSVALTIYHLAAYIPYERLKRLVRNVCKRSSGVLDQLHDLLPILAASGRNGISNMRLVLDRFPRGYRFPDSGNELRFEDLMMEAGITSLRRQVDLGGHEWIGRVDYLCELTGVIFEIDSELHHTSPEDMAADAARDAAMKAAGFADVVRIWTESLWSRPWEAAQIVRRTRAKHLRPAA